MDEYVPEFSARHVDGRELLQMDGSKLKVRMTILCEHAQFTFVLNVGMWSTGSGRAQFV